MVTCYWSGIHFRHHMNHWTMSRFHNIIFKQISNQVRFNYVDLATHQNKPTQLWFIYDRHTMMDMSRSLWCHPSPKVAPLRQQSIPRSPRIAGDMHFGATDGHRSTLYASRNPDILQHQLKNGTLLDNEWKTMETVFKSSGPWNPNLDTQRRVELPWMAMNKPKFFFTKLKQKIKGVAYPWMHLCLEVSNPN